MAARISDRQASLAAEPLYKTVEQMLRSKWPAQRIYDQLHAEMGDDLLSVAAFVHQKDRAAAVIRVAAKRWTRKVAR